MEIGIHNPVHQNEVLCLTHCALIHFYYVYVHCKCIQMIDLMFTLSEEFESCGVYTWVFTC